MIEGLVRTTADWVPAIARLILGIVFFAHGAEKMLGWFGGAGFNATLQTLNKHLRIPRPLAVLVISAEFFGGLGLIVGLLSRIAAVGIVLTMLGAIVIVNRRYGLFMDWYGNRKGHGFEYHLLAIALALVVIVKGAGAFSIDYLWYQHDLGKTLAQQSIARR